METKKLNLSPRQDVRVGDAGLEFLFMQHWGDGVGRVHVIADHCLGTNWATSVWLVRNADNAAKWDIVDDCNWTVDRASHVDADKCIASGLTLQAARKKAIAHLIK